MTKGGKRLLIGLGIFFILFCLLLAAPVLYIQTDHAQQLIQKQINTTIPGTLSWIGFRFSLLGGKFELEKVLLKGPAGEELAGFDRLLLTVSWNTLLDRELTISALHLDRPWVKLSSDRKGKLNIMEAFPSSHEGAKTEKTTDKKKT